MSNQLGNTGLFCLGLLLAALIHLGSASIWRLADVRCASQDSPSALEQLAAITERQCVMKASERVPMGALVAQFSQLDGRCTVFNFQAICRSLMPGPLPGCSVFFRFPLDHTRLNPKLNNVWLADDVSRLENLVCQASEDTNRLLPVGVQWSSEGASFDGIAAYAMLNRSSIGFTGGLTWLLRLKRQPREQPYFEFNDCNTLGTSTGTSVAIHVWELGTSGKLELRRNLATGTMLPIIFLLDNIITATASDWLNIGFTSTASGDSVSVFLKDASVPPGSTSSATDADFQANSMCMYFGARFAYPKTMFNGTLKALAFGNSSMTEAEMRLFFHLLGV